MPSSRCPSHEPPKYHPAGDKVTPRALSHSSPQPFDDLSRSSALIMARTQRAPLRKKDWSPAPRDPRFSNNTPGELFGRVVAQKAAGKRIGTWRLWLLARVQDEARKIATNDPRRKRLLFCMEECARQAEEQVAETTQEVMVDSPAPAKPHGLSETAVLLPRARARVD